MIAVNPAAIIIKYKKRSAQSSPRRHSPAPHTNHHAYMHTTSSLHPSHTRQTINPRMHPHSNRSSSKLNSCRETHHRYRYLIASISVSHCIDIGISLHRNRHQSGVGIFSKCVHARRINSIAISRNTLNETTQAMTANLGIHKSYITCTMAVFPVFVTITHIDMCIYHESLFRLLLPPIIGFSMRKESEDDVGAAASLVAEDAGGRVDATAVGKLVLLLPLLPLQPLLLSLLLLLLLPLLLLLRGIRVEMSPPWPPPNKLTNAERMLLFGGMIAAVLSLPASL